MPEVNLARSFLIRANDALDAGDKIAAGCLLREAVTRQLKAMCEWHDCVPKAKLKHVDRRVTEESYLDPRITETHHENERLFPLDEEGESQQ